MAILELISTLQLILVLIKMDIDTTYIPSYIKTFKRFLFLCAAVQSDLAWNLVDVQKF